VPAALRVFFLVPIWCVPIHPPEFTVLGPMRDPGHAFSFVSSQLVLLFFFVPFFFCFSKTIFSYFETLLFSHQSNLIFTFFFHPPAVLFHLFSSRRFLRAFVQPMACLSRSLRFSFPKNVPEALYVSPPFFPFPGRSTSDK